MSSLDIQILRGQSQVARGENTTSLHCLRHLPKHCPALPPDGISLSHEPGVVPPVNQLGVIPGGHLALKCFQGPDWAWCFCLKREKTGLSDPKCLPAAGCLASAPALFLLRTPLYICSSWREQSHSVSLELILQAAPVLQSERPTGIHHRRERQNPAGSSLPRVFWKALAKPEFPAHALELAILPLKPKKVAGTAIYLSHGFHNFPGTLANH